MSLPIGCILSDFFVEHKLDRCKTTSLISVWVPLSLYNSKQNLITCQGQQFHFLRLGGDG